MNRALATATRAVLSAAMLLLTCCTLSERPGAAGPAPEPASVSGLVTTADGRGAADTFVFAYRQQRGTLRGPADFGIRTESDGRYLLELPPGPYLLVARQSSTPSSGRPRPGDAWALFAGNPVTVKDGHQLRADFLLQTSARPMLMKSGSLVTGDTGFAGRLVDAEGRPVAGAFALAYLDRDFHRMPDHTSTPATNDGRFVLYVPDAGRYCLAARTKTRGQPVAGEPYGLLATGTEECPDVEKGQIREVGTIVLTPYRR